MDTITLDQTIPISSLQRDYNAVIKQVQKSKKSIVLMKYNKPVVRMISEAVYKQLKKFECMYEEERILRLSAEAKEEYRTGKMLTSDDGELEELIKLV